MLGLRFQLLHGSVQKDLVYNKNTEALREDSLEERAS